ncbi:protein kinase family protein [Streptomonospora litoralis]|uniref:Serine/threonine-protein kinase PK-1 n=1 Tax=Streptomonospora litoralis TaxID=2498135 RepID=A0A4P6QAG0_9ACTN|nr:protein kinase family protein [Streptomonospora litoralis]QBI56731.1 Serine/threonine-protein kinase PK-1 [Streptomonospora litoralis]
MIEPGARLAGRYRLDSQVSQTAGATLWKATDETLARLVAVWTFAEGFPRTGEVVRAARATSRIADSRVTQVFDADDSGPAPYVVEEWVAGQSLADLLAQGPLPPERAAGLIAEAAETMATAHAAGLYHLNLTPGKLIWSLGGAIKVTGIGVDAALRGIGADNPAAADAQGLGRLLYAALTAHWPDEARNGLRPAPVIGGAPCQPSQLNPAISQYLNDLVCRSAFLAPLRGGALTDAREIADALANVPRMVPLPVSPPNAPMTPEPPRGTSRRSGEFQAASEAPPTAQRQAPPPPPQQQGRRRSGVPPAVSRALVGALALIVFVGVVWGAWTVGTSMSGGGGNGGEDGQTSSGGQEDQAPELTVLKPQSADGFDPLSDANDEHNEIAGQAIDGQGTTGWHTEGYDTADLGGLKSGVGLIVDLGQPAEVHDVSLNLGQGPHDLQILVGDAADPAALGAGESPAAQKSGVQGEVDIGLAEPATGRYVVVWFTSLPRDDVRYRGTVNEVELRGKT